MRRPSYAAVTGVTAAMVFLGFARVALVRFIPPPHPQIAQWGQGEFVRRAQAQEISWRPLGPKAFQEAQALSRPVLLVVGVPWSALGRQADQTFAVPEVARALNRNFVPIRVDTAQDPRWISQFLPLQRTHMGFGVGFQAWAFDLKGRLIAFIGRVDANDVLDEATVVRSLLNAQSEFAKAALSDEPPDFEENQVIDVGRLTTPGVVNLSLANAAQSLAGEIDPVWGGWSMRGLIGTRPLALRFLQLAGEWDKAGRSLRRTVLSSRADWLDGGFFRVVRRDNGVPEYDKTTLSNAQLAETLAVQDAAHPDPLLRRFARRTVDWVLSLQPEVYLPGAEMGDEDERGRSGRASFSPLRLSEAVRAGSIKSEDADWARANLGLDGRGGPARIVVPSAAALADPRFARVLADLRRAAGPPRVHLAPGLADVNGEVAACLLRCARLWGDRDLAATAGEIVDRLDGRFRGANGVSHTLDPDPSGPLYLSDALAYADAALQDFLVNGRLSSLEHGAFELRRALRVFGKDGILRTGRPQDSLFAGLAPLPQVTDDECEATSASALRLLDAYATILGPTGGDLAALSARLDDNLGAVTEAVPAMGGALGALTRHLDSRAAFVVGFDALQVANRLARRFPNRLVVPALTGTRTDLANRRPGIYLSTSSGLVGPFSESALAGQLPPDLEVGL